MKKKLNWFLKNTGQIILILVFMGLATAFFGWLLWCV